MSALLGLECPECGTSYAADRIQTVCVDCDSPLLARYDLPLLARTLDRDETLRRPTGLWRWAELLPVDDVRFRISLGEGDTPFLEAPRLGRALGVDRLYIKDEATNPTGSFKARGMAVALSKAAELGVREVIVPTAGNAGGALAAYAARAGLTAHVIMPADADVTYQAEVRAAGADLRLVDGLLDAAGKQAKSLADERGWFNLATFREPYRVEGKKTMGFEIAEAMSWELPDVVVYPTGGGTGLVGLAKAFDELERLGWIGAKRPRLVAVQPAGCAPVVRALEQGAARIEAWQRATTRAQGLRVPRPYADRAILREVRRSAGAGVAVSEGEIDAALAETARAEGILPCLEGAAAVAGLRRLVENGGVEREARVVVFNTGAGLKVL